MYCTSEQNPRDILTRGIKDEFPSSKLWEKGPDWITDDSRFPNQPSVETTVIFTSAEEQVTKADDTHVNFSTTGIHSVFDVERFSRYKTLLRVTAYVMKFINMCRSKNTDNRYTTSTAKEIHDAEKMWLHSCQSTAYEAERACLETGKRHLPLVSQVRQLQLYLDGEGYIRCGGRIHNAPLAEHARCPYLLPASHHLTRLIIVDAHERHMPA